jgi:hypothetical protein
MIASVTTAPRTFLAMCRGGPRNSPQLLTVARSLVSRRNCRRSLRAALPRDLTLRCIPHHGRQKPQPLPRHETLAAKGPQPGADAPRMTAAVTATAGSDHYQQRSATAHNARTIRTNLACARPESANSALQPAPESAVHYERRCPPAPVHCQRSQADPARTLTVVRLPRFDGQG